MQYIIVVFIPFLPVSSYKSNSNGLSRGLTYISIGVLQFPLSQGASLEINQFIANTKHRSGSLCECRVTAYIVNEDVPRFPSYIKGSVV